MDETEAVNSMRTLEEIEQLCRELEKSPTDATRSQQLIHLIALSRTHRPELVVLYGRNLLQRNDGGNKFWSCIEQTFLASLELNDIDTAQKALDKLQKEFPKSKRVERLKGLLLEATEKYDEAIQFYDAIIRTNETNVFAHKRKCCIVKAKDGVDAAIVSLNEYLKVFMSDVSAWQELADLYMTSNRLSEAAYCYEELILAQPQNYMFLNMYAEILYTLGDNANIRQARQYFAQSYELHAPGNLKALYGMLMSSQALLSGGGCGDEAEREKCEALSQNGTQFAGKELANFYKSHKSPLAETVRKVFSA